jgi:hypothetical protein
MTFGPGTLFSDPKHHDGTLYDRAIIERRGWDRWLTRPCGCDQPFKLVEKIIANGSIQFVLKCASCERHASSPIPHTALDPKDRDIAATNRELLTDPDRPCARCGEWRCGVELHHWAPVALFEDAHQWPSCWLCVKCHLRWHKTMIGYTVT